ncbi:MAG: cellulase family glycosylhydrolase [Gemmatimonadetes bacterium]|nr:cellulase family glycosylhydrolase [Gemmatimonadota bacterium]
MAIWTPEKTRDWYKKPDPIRGCNYLPGTAVNSAEMWQEETFDPESIDRELAWAAHAGYNSVRVFLQYLVWAESPDGLERRIDQFLSIAAKHGIGTTPILFCDCAFADREPYLGRQDDPVPGVHNSGWVPSPGLQRVADRSVWPDLEKYVTGIVSRFAGDGRVLLWDLYNEPGNSQLGEESLPLVEASFSWARSAGPEQPITTGLWTDFDSPMSKRIAELSDIISFHAYDPPEGVREKVDQCAAYGRPLICTEWLHRQTGNTFESILPIFAENRIGWYHWGLVAGRTQTYMHWGSQAGDPIPDIWQHDTFHEDGRPYDPGEIEQVGRFSFSR